MCPICVVLYHYRYLKKRVFYVLFGCCKKFGMMTIALDFSLELHLRAEKHKHAGKTGRTSFVFSDVM